MARRRRLIGDGTCVREERCGSSRESGKGGKWELWLGSYRAGRGRDDGRLSWPSVAKKAPVALMAIKGRP
jgi:hypothetical protein